MSSNGINPILQTQDEEIIETLREHFDTEFYLSQYPDVAMAGVDPVSHYCTFGWRENRDPTGYFSTSDYILKYSDVRDLAINPFWHYVAVGKAEGRIYSKVVPPLDLEAISNAKVIANDQFIQEIGVIGGEFDVEFYLQQNPDVAEAGVDAVEHFITCGWKERRDPNGWFSVGYYLEANPDVYEAGVNPFWHYLVAGKAEGRACIAPPSAPGLKNISPDQVHADTQVAQQVAAIRGAFDTNFYLLQNPDVAEAGIDPVEHFVTSGWMERRNPNQSFSVAYYLESNPDVFAAGVNPFWHYIIAGKAEGRAAVHPGGYRAETLMHTRPLEETVKVWRSRMLPEINLTATEIICQIVDAAPDNAALLMLSVGHDNYLEVSGGVQLCIQHEEEAARAKGIVYLNLHPHQPLPRLAHTSETPDVSVGLVLAGTMIGSAPMSVVTDAISKLACEFSKIKVVVHHLMGHSPEQLVALVHAAGQNSCVLWLHDFFTLCPSHALQRNNVAFCGAPELVSNSCRLCLYGKERADHQVRIARFFQTLSVHVVAPSQFAANYWSARTVLKPTTLTVREHIKVDWRSRKRKLRATDAPATVAFIGYPAAHKGWPVFEKVVKNSHIKGAACRFLYFGMSQIEISEIDRVPVGVTADNPDAMIKALVTQKVDIVLHWATCPETFSFSTHEALAAGAYVLTNPLSGNVAATVRRVGRGAVLSNEADLESFFCDGRLEAMVSEARSRRSTSDAIVTRSDLTISVIDQEEG